MKIDIKMRYLKRFNEELDTKPGFAEKRLKLQKNFEEIRDKTIDKEIAIATEEKFPGLETILKKLEKMREIDDPKEFVSKYMKLTGATRYDLSKELSSL